MADDKGRIRTPMSPARWEDAAETDVVVAPEQEPAKAPATTPATAPAKEPVKEPAPKK